MIFIGGGQEFLEVRKGERQAEAALLRSDLAARQAGRVEFEGARPRACARACGSGQTGDRKWSNW